MSWYRGGPQYEYNWRSWRSCQLQRAVRSLTMILSHALPIVWGVSACTKCSALLQWCAGDRRTNVYSSSFNVMIEFKKNWFDFKDWKKSYRTIDVVNSSKAQVQNIFEMIYNRPFLIRLFSAGQHNNPTTMNLEHTVLYICAHGKENRRGREGERKHTNIQTCKGGTFKKNLSSNHQKKVGRTSWTEAAADSNHRGSLLRCCPHRIHRVDT